MTCGAAPVRTGDRSSSNVTCRTRWSLRSTPRCPGASASDFPASPALNARRGGGAQSMGSSRHCFLQTGAPWRDLSGRCGAHFLATMTIAAIVCRL